MLDLLLGLVSNCCKEMVREKRFFLLCFKELTVTVIVEIFFPIKHHCNSARNISQCQHDTQPLMLQQPRYNTVASNRLALQFLKKKKKSSFSFNFKKVKINGYPKLYIMNLKKQRVFF